MLHASAIWHLLSTPPWRKQWGLCDPHRILVTTEITSPPPAPGAQVWEGGGWSPTSMSAAPSERATGQHRCPKSCQKPSMSKVILRAVADKGTCKCVSLATLKKALATTGYDMARNACHFKRVLKGLVDKGSFRLGTKQASKPKLKVKRRRQQSRSGQRYLGRRRSLLGSKQGHKRLVKGVRRVAKCHRN
uniref:H15 domain-containing protein n=1 Tax=Saimiri boliviensis boliviensis TaxID=39432 RepID=A0A2K6UKM9_SAIBB